MTEPRYLAAKLLDKTFKSGSYSNIQLGSGLERSDLDSQGRRLCTVLYYGVIQRRITLDHVLARYCSRPLAKMDSIIVTILRCGLYQILYMDNIPDNAAVNESVRLAKQFGKTSASGMVNAVLRNFIRDGKVVISERDKENISELGRISAVWSIPEELAESLISDYGEDIVERFIRFTVTDSGETFIRRNPLKCTHEELSEALHGVELQTDDQLCYRLKSGSVIDTDAFRSGFFHVQDISSQLCCMALAPTENDRVLDICAAPGGKTFTMAEMMNGRGEIHAFDLHEKRVKLIREGAERLGLSNISAKTGDAIVFMPELPKFTKILCDVPCSGYGVIGHKPEIKYKRLSEFERLPEIQYNIADNALNYLAVGGEMVYSTCTVRKAENEAVVQKILENHPETELAELPELYGRSFDNPKTFFPCDFSGDGFFIAKFRKKF
ncbi:MAG: 16S rRNA (cytosine(967)-C(5))-methyltransferase RsmB [Ruminococcus sp.]|nr:16S rRNA (cytosine(967)-C(5))-methyltransferase RsmB [Ruminococcus sp.]